MKCLGAYFHLEIRSRRERGRWVAGPEMRVHTLMFRVCVFSLSPASQCGGDSIHARIWCEKKL